LIESGPNESLALPEIPAGPIPPQAGPAPEVTASPEPAISGGDRIAQLMQVATQHEDAGRLDDAQNVLSHVLTEAPLHHPALHLMGIIAFKKGNAEESAQLIERSIALSPTTALYHRNIGEIYRVVGRLDEALVAGRRAAALTPEDVHCYHNLAVLHYHRLELDEAIACAERAAALDPNFPGAHFGIAEATLLRGEFERGWDEYEWRLKLANAPPLLPPTEQPQWDGTPIEGTLLVIADQGYGDVIQFARYMPWAAARCGQLAVACRGATAWRGLLVRPLGAGTRLCRLFAALQLAATGRNATGYDPGRNSLFALRPRQAGALGRAARRSRAGRLPPDRHRLGRPADPSQRPQPLGRAEGVRAVGRHPRRRARVAAERRGAIGYR
jgi:tetratricopeptide (TPR) repeat protein